MRNGKARTTVRHIPDHTADWWRVRAEHHFRGTAHRTSEAFSFILTLLKHRLPLPSIKPNTAGE
jgi:hypothetical protein